MLWHLLRFREKCIHVLGEYYLFLLQDISALWDSKMDLVLNLVSPLKEIMLSIKKTKKKFLYKAMYYSQKPSTPCVPWEYFDLPRACSAEIIHIQPGSEPKPEREWAEGSVLWSRPGPSSLAEDTTALLRLKRLLMAPILTPHGGRRGTNYFSKGPTEVIRIHYDFINTLY